MNTDVEKKYMYILNYPTNLKLNIYFFKRTQRQTDVCIKMRKKTRQLYIYIYI